ncbi:hypothetical protein AQPE_0120 [Aquipluma nitroreducens]|uniref:Uncharacterized protein n=1 Tax=Aquipluma nitroreducens TaxID=2010828 RepID=A0A5K7S368_9BACT|nr:hypothetical protein AQPE_0120 [Aquipluma nitroreducens]
MSNISSVKFGWNGFSVGSSSENSRLSWIITDRVTCSS